MDHAGVAAKLQVQADLHKRLAEISQSRKALEDEEQHLLQRLQGIDDEDVAHAADSTIARGSGVRITDVQLRQAQKHRADVEVDRNGIAVAISCHICHANVGVKGNILNLHALRVHYYNKHRSELQITGPKLTSEEVLNMARKSRISAADLENIVRGAKPQALALAINKGSGKDGGGSSRKRIKLSDGDDDDDDKDGDSESQKVQRPRKAARRLQSTRVKREGDKMTVNSGEEIALSPQRRTSRSRSFARSVCEDAENSEDE